MSQLEQLEQRIAALERANRRMRLLGIAVGATGAGLALLGAAQPANKPPEEIRARRFVVEDEHGVVRAQLGITKQGASVLALCDEAAKPRLLLRVIKEQGPEITLRDEKGSDRASFYFSAADGSPGLDFYDPSSLRATLNISQNGWPGLRLLDKEGKLRAAIAVDDSGTPGLTMRDGKGGLRTFLTLLEDGRPGLDMRDADGRVRLMMSLFSEDAGGGSGWLRMSDKNGNAEWTTLYFPKKGENK